MSNLIFESLVSAHWLGALAWTLLHFLWQGTAIAALAGVAWFALRRSSAHVRYGVGCAALVAMVVAPLVTFFLQDGFAVAPTVSSIVSAAPVAAVAAPRTLSQTLQPWLVFAWSCGVLVLSARLLGGLWWVQWLRRRNTRAVEPTVAAVGYDLKQRMGIRQAVRWLESSRVSVPMVIGWIKPVVLVPAGMLCCLSPAELESVLAHELAHIRRRDYLVNLLQTAVETVLFYHPAVWWISHRVRIEREHCCDDRAIATCGDRLTLVRALVHLEQTRAPGLAAAANGGSLLQRVQRLLGSPTQQRFAPSRWSVTAVLLAVLALAATNLGMSAPPILDNVNLALAGVQEDDEETDATPKPGPDPAPTLPAGPGKADVDDGPAEPPAATPAKSVVEIAIEMEFDDEGEDTIELDVDVHGTTLSQVSAARIEALAEETEQRVEQLLLIYEPRLEQLEADIELRLEHLEPSIEMAEHLVVMNEETTHHTEELNRITADIVLLSTDLEQVGGEEFEELLEELGDAIEVMVEQQAEELAIIAEMELINVRPDLDQLETRIIIHGGDTAEALQTQAEYLQTQAEALQEQAEALQEQAEELQHQAEEREAEAREHEAEAREHEAEAREHEAEAREHEAEERKRAEKDRRREERERRKEERQRERDED